ncbi:conserved phage C-terminal domain-containing protein [Solibacillus sp. FSL W7-1464]|uniref:conserved phage C-terminal domain-containing protein n=1 Tax=Solibacillus sp. FSL W7-1464 TaxID=2921706 RepID=UPI0030F87851
MKLLVNERHLFVSPNLAARIGVEEALFLQQLYYRIETQGVEKEGHKWYRQTYQGWSKQCFYWDKTKVKRLITKLERSEIIISSDKFNRFNTDRSKWYRIDDEKVNQLLETEIFTQEELLPEEPKLPEEKEEKPNTDSSNEIANIIDYLNEKAKKNFNGSSKTTIRLIKAILKEGYTAEDCRLVIDEQVRNWKNDPQMNKYLRPITLFRPGNFESYLNDAQTRQQENHLDFEPVILDFDEGECY